MDETMQELSFPAAGDFYVPAKEPPAELLAHLEIVGDVRVPDENGGGEVSVGRYLGDPAQGKDNRYLLIVLDGTTEEPRQLVRACAAAWNACASEDDRDWTYSLNTLAALSSSQDEAVKKAAAADLKVVKRAFKASRTE